MVYLGMAVQLPRVFKSTPAITRSPGREHLQSSEGFLWATLPLLLIRVGLKN